MENKEVDQELDRRLTNTWKFIFNIWKNKWFVLFMDVLRILTFFLLIYIIFTLVTEIEAVKLLAYDPCKICMNKTGATCISRFIP